MGSPMQTKRIAILGSTGSVGRQALEIIAGEERFSACALAAGSNWELLAEQAGRSGAEFVAIADATRADDLAAALPAAAELFTGDDALGELIGRARPDMVLTAVVGSAGLAPTLAAIDCGADLAVANKESLVMGGAVIMPAARRAGVRVLPVDSEHSAIFQCLAGHRREDVRRIVLTASGGPFRTATAQQVRDASLEEVLNHPTWRMGRKVTVDSATLMNKTMEVVEAHWLFDLPGEQIEVVIHPESVVHGLVEFRDGSVLAQMGQPSMATPIAFALYYPERAPRAAAELELPALGSLHFEPVDQERFRALRLGYEAIRRGPAAGAALNAANEVAVEAFLAGELQFGRIVEIVEEVLNQAAPKTEVSLDMLLAADAAARRLTRETIARDASRSGRTARPAV